MTDDATCSLFASSMKNSNDRTASANATVGKRVVGREEGREGEREGGREGVKEGQRGIFWNATYNCPVPLTSNPCDNEDREEIDDSLLSL